MQVFRITRGKKQIQTKSFGVGIVSSWVTEGVIFFNGIVPFIQGMEPPRERYQKTHPSVTPLRGGLGTMASGGLFGIALSTQLAADRLQEGHILFHWGPRGSQLTP